MPLSVWHKWSLLKVPAPCVFSHLPMFLLLICYIFHFRNSKDLIGCRLPTRILQYLHYLFYSIWYILSSLRHHLHKVSSFNSSVTVALGFLAEKCTFCVFPFLQASHAISHIHPALSMYSFNILAIMAKNRMQQERQNLIMIALAKPWQRL